MVCLQGTLQFPYSLRSLLIFIKLVLIYHFLYVKTRSLNGDYRWIKQEAFQRAQLKKNIDT